MSNIKPIIRTTVAFDADKIWRESVYSVLSTLTKHTPVDGAFQNCISCIHFKENEEKCILYNQRPPARVIAFGCASYTDKEDVPY